MFFCVAGQSQLCPYQGEDVWHTAGWGGRWQRPWLIAIADTFICHQSGLFSPAPPLCPLESKREVTQYSLSMENHSRTSVSLTEKARTFSVSHSPSLYAGGHSLYTPARCLVHAQRPGARPRFGWQACLLACRQEQDWPGIQGRRSSAPESFSALHFLYDIHRKLAIVCYFLFICLLFLPTTKETSQVDGFILFVSEL